MDNLSYNFNQLSGRLGDIADRISSESTDISEEISSLTSALNTTNYLLGALIFLVAVYTVISL
ncbi:hypothetical protein [Radiobacillus deserti]|uniref:Uncharacterized protein n=1 Tax=Radiobacillus deserti TaxID=2594883 RepID=A0A516KIB6_9BACI|nr:hypothetical protein [Radiobacillus deserti]QDP41138.1 hypothetical protein FN924_13625 [Radiobacillus deserti]